MRRVLLPLTGLVAGTTLLISLKSAPGASRLPHEIAAQAQAAAEAQQSSGPAVPTIDPTATYPGTTAPADPGPAPQTTVAPTSTTAPPPAPGGNPPAPPPAPPAPPPPPPGGGTTFTGESVYTDFGYVTVAIIVAGGRMTDVVAVEMPSEHSRSVTLSNRAAPILREWALSAQGAQIDTVSGATYTSEGYRESLQSALDQAGLA